MADLIKVTKTCTRCGKASTHRTSSTRYVSAPCQHCGGSVYLGKKLIADARAAQQPTATVPGMADEWKQEQPFTGLDRRPRPNGTCAECGARTDQGSPRGTFVWCGECQGYRYDQATGTRRRAAVARIDRAARNAERAAERAAASAAIDQAPDVAAVLDLAGEIGVIRAGIAQAVRELHDAPTRQLGQRAANAAARLQALDQAVSQAARAADPHGTLNALQPYLAAELDDAGRIADAIERENAAIDMDEARDAAHRELLEERRAAAIVQPERRALTVAAPPRIPAIAPWKLCEGPHRLIRPFAALIVRMSATRHGSPEKQLSICGQHDPARICTAYGYSYFTTVPLNTGEMKANGARV